jgi:NitT/TauT family transport system ATP-binding protein
MTASDRYMQRTPTGRSDVPELEATDVEMEYERRDGTLVRAIDNITLQISSGEFVSIVGPSGCGKTTFLKIVNGLLEPTGGRILVRGHPLAKNTGDRAMVFQEASLFPWYSVARNVGYGLECQKVSRREAEARAQPFIEMVGLAGFEKHYPYELSGGMQQRANLARALVVDPAVLLMDEPFASLDAQTREMMQAELLDIWALTTKTVLFITHQINEAIYLSDRVIVMSARPGRILADVAIDLPRPRGLEIKRSERFLRYEDEIWAMIETQARASMRASTQASLDREPGESGA